MPPPNNFLQSSVEDWHNRASTAQAAVDQLLARHDGAVRARARELRDLIRDLNKLPIDIQTYFQEAVQCLEHGLTRAAVVLSWAGFFYTASQYFFSNHESSIRAKYDKWSFNNFEDLLESRREAELIEAMSQLKMLNKADRRHYDGQLAQRNKCAHPTLYKPSQNAAIGYVDEMIQQTIRFI
jgi:hypothetical protein